MKKLFAEPEANIYKLTCTDIVYTSAEEITEPTVPGGDPVDPVGM